MSRIVEIYTDGACIGNGNKVNLGGCSFVVIENEELLSHNVRVEKNTTNNRQEIFGVFNALQFCLEFNITSFIIYSDSQYTVNGFNEWMFKWEQKKWSRGYPPQLIPNSDLWKQMFDIKNEFLFVDLRWVRGHDGNKWNELADKLIEIEMAKQPDFINIQKKSYNYANRSQTS